MLRRNMLGSCCERRCGPTISGSIVSDGFRICEASVLKNIIPAFSVSCDGSELVRSEEDAVGKHVRGNPQMTGSVQGSAQEVGLDHKTQRADRS